LKTKVLYLSVSLFPHSQKEDSNLNFWVLEKENKKISNRSMPFRSTKIYLKNRDIESQCFDQSSFHKNKMLKI